jgi:queuine/archaeosine tRNA-ribosyltransferase
MQYYFLSINTYVVYFNVIDEILKIIKSIHTQLQAHEQHAISSGGFQAEARLGFLKYAPTSMARKDAPAGNAAIAW